MEEEYDIGCGCNFFHFIESLDKIENENLRNTYLSMFFGHLQNLVSTGKATYLRLKTTTNLPQFISTLAEGVFLQRLDKDTI